MVPRVTVLGSCRVFEPFKLLADDGRITLKNQGVYGYTHCAKEAVQQLAVMRGEKRIPVGLSLYITHKKLPSNAANVEFVTTPANDLSETDLLVVEISSLKEIDYKGYYLQINRVREQLIAKNPQLTDWWKAIYDKNAKVDRRAYRDQMPRATERGIVAFTKISIQDQSSLRQDIENIAASFAGPTLFVSHFNTMTFEGRRIPIRDQLVEYVEIGAAEIGQPFFNPRGLIEGFGLELALQDLAHYNPPFERALGENFYARIARLEPMASMLAGAEPVPSAAG
jgi:hypothetical protein